jgi:opacity protein-like surface antigen
MHQNRCSTVFNSVRHLTAAPEKRGHFINYLENTHMNNILSKRNIFSALLLASAVSSAHAGWYTESTVLNSDLDDTALSSTGRDVNIEFDEDLGFSTAIGFEFSNGLRLEGEYLSTENDTETVNFNGTNFSGGAARGNIETESIFFNLIKSFNHAGTYSPYIGAGIGYTDVESSVSYGNGSAAINDSDEVFSYQFLAGLDVAFTSKLSGFVEYRFVGADDVSLNRFGGGPGGLQNTTQEGDIELDAFALGLKYNFN